MTGLIKIWSRTTYCYPFMWTLVWLFLSHLLCAFWLNCSFIKPNKCTHEHVHLFGFINEQFGMISLYILFYFVTLVCKYSCSLYVLRPYIKTDVRRSIVQISWWYTSNSTIILCLEVTWLSHSWSDKVQLFDCLRETLASVCHSQLTLYNEISICATCFGSVCSLHEVLNLKHLEEEDSAVDCTFITSWGRILLYSKHLVVQ